jgi:hypothetical protein
MNIHNNLGESIRQSPEDLATCSVCSCAWMEVVRVGQFSKHENLSLGQPPTEALPAHTFYMYRCLKCGMIYRPNITINSYNSVTKTYDKFLDHLAEPIPDPGQGEIV